MARRYIRGTRCCRCKRVDGPEATLVLIPGFKPYCSDCLSTLLETA